MFKTLKKKSRKKVKNKWTNRKIAFVSILIATSVTFVLIFARILPITTIPSFKIAIGGLPIKLTGYIFGPVIGLITGIISDLLSFALIPVSYHWAYTLAFGLSGFIPGVVGHFMNRKWRNKHEVDQMFSEKHNRVNFLVTILILNIIFVITFVFIYQQPESVFNNPKSLINNRWAFLVISSSGSFSMVVAVFIFRFVLKPKTFNALLPIIVFSAILEMPATLLITYGDMNVYNQEDAFIALFTIHMLVSPAKIWTNMIIILFTYKIISPLIYKKTDNGWEAGK